MAQKDPNSVAQKWATNLGGATTAIQDGVNAVTTSPGQAAARNKAGYLAGVNANVNKWATAVAAVTTNDWQTAMLTKGVPRIATGAAAAQPKMATFMQKLLPFQASLVASLPPRGDLNQNIQRATAFMTGMAKFQN